MGSPIVGFDRIALGASDHQKSKQFSTDTFSAWIIEKTYPALRGSHKLDLCFSDSSRIELLFPEPPLPLATRASCEPEHFAFRIVDAESVDSYLQEKSITCEPIRIDELTGRHVEFFRNPDNFSLEFYEII
ncbi:MAG TPA: hypothetical protein DD638_01075 [Pasteurellaceae bacterium]|nr:hypothetical protein [Pasteurellaceae bacterium]